MTPSAYMSSKLLWALCAVSLLFLSATVFYSQQTSAASPFDSRRTLYAPFGETYLKLEAPESMCFLDATKPNEGELLYLLKTTEHTPDLSIIAAFTNCYDIAKFGKEPATGKQEIGIIQWQHATKNNQNFMNIREESFRDKIERSFAPHAYSQTDQTIHKGQDHISLTYMLETDLGYQKFKTYGVYAMTQIKGRNIEIHYKQKNVKEPPPASYFYSFMDDFVAKQHSINAQ